MTNGNNLMELALTAAIALSALTSALTGRDPALAGPDSDSGARGFIDRMVVALGPWQNKQPGAQD